MQELAEWYQSLSVAGGMAVSHGASFEHFLVFLSGRDTLHGTVREEVKHCHGEMLACTGGINLQNLLPRSIFKASLLTGVKRGRGSFVDDMIRKSH